MSGPEIFGVDLFGNTAQQPARGPVSEKFLFPPFSVLDTKQGEWQERRRAWLKIGLKSEVGRAGDLTFNTKDSLKGAENFHDTSVFDPVLCELVYRWFCPAKGQVVDPFAGGSVRGIMAGSLGLNYWGCDLRREQVDANYEQVNTIKPAGCVSYAQGDSCITLDRAPQADFIFSCPPYGDLEVYSDDPRDLSNMNWNDFLFSYRTIIVKALGRLKPNRFAAFVVGDFRDPKGNYRNFTGETVGMFLETENVKLYNEAIILNAIGTAGMRVTKQFAASRKFAKIHQNLLVFCKGDWKKAAEACKAVDA